MSDIQNSKWQNTSNVKIVRKSFQIRHKYDKDIHKCLTYVLSKGQLGDWFVLYQLCKNCNPFFYREFIKELAIELKHRPKKSRAISSKTSLGEAFVIQKLVLKKLFSENGLTSPLSTPYNSRSKDDANIISLMRDENKEEIQV